MLLPKTHALICVLILLAITATSPAHAVEKLGFTVVEQHKDLQIRRYPAHLLASVIVKGEFAEVGSEAFRPLFRFISGDNQQQQKIAMTAPVLQRPASDGTGDAEPQSAKQWVVSFVMPKTFNRNSLPDPDAKAITVTEEPETLMATIEYRGGWSRERYESYYRQLLGQLEETSYQPCGSPRWARHDPPMMPWFLRKNEILLPVCSG